MEVLSLDASKVLQDIMPERTKYMYFEMNNWKYELLNMETANMSEKVKNKWIKILTLSEALDLLPDYFLRDNKYEAYTFEIRKSEWVYYANYIHTWHMWSKFPLAEIDYWKTLIKSVENLLIWLHENNYLTKTND